MRKPKQQRRNKGEGSVTVMPNGKYKMTFTIGVGLDGKQKRKSVTGSSRQEVLDKAATLRHKFNIGEISTEMKQISFGEYKQKWLDNKSISIAMNTHISYKSILGYCKPLDIFIMSKISSDMITEHLKTLPVAKSTLRLIKTALGAIFREAVCDGTIIKSPMVGVMKIGKNKRKVDSQLPTEEQIKDLLRLIQVKEWPMQRDKMMYAFFLLAVTSGLRRGEMLGLKWSDIDKKNNKISVNRQVTNAGRNEPLKTKASYRTIHIPKKTIENLCALEDTSKSEYVFDCGNISCHSWLGYFTMSAKKLMRLLHFPEDCSLHSLRHYHATYLLSKGVSIKIVSKRLGHSSVVVTLDNYTHFIPSMDAEASKIFDDFGAY
jgi:phage integrase